MERAIEIDEILSTGLCRPGIVNKTRGRGQVEQSRLSDHGSGLYPSRKREGCGRKREGGCGKGKRGTWGREGKTLEEEGGHTEREGGSGDRRGVRRSW